MLERLRPRLEIKPAISIWKADLIDNCWAIEVKLSSALAVDCGFHNAADDIAASRRILIYKGKECFPMWGGIEAIPLLDAMNEVSVAVGA